MSECVNCWQPACSYNLDPVLEQFAFRINQAAQKLAQARADNANAEIAKACEAAGVQEQPKKYKACEFHDAEMQRLIARLVELASQKSSA